MIRDCAEDCEERIEPRTRFFLSPRITAREISWHYWPPEGVEYGSDEYWIGYGRSMKAQARWYENDYARWKLTQMHSKEIVD